MTEQLICPCEGFSHPAVILNLPGRSAIAYRVGDYASFRHALLLPLKDKDGKLKETELTNWHPSAKGDLALQMVEWWAYLADILTFYNERIANESYLRTADLPESVQRLIRTLGYRPRPGIGAWGVIAALSNSSKPFILPQGFQIQSKPGPGKQPQIFELDADTAIASPDAVTADPVANPLLLQGNSVLLQGQVTTVKPGDQLLLLKRGWIGVESNSPFQNLGLRSNIARVSDSSLARSNVKSDLNYALVKVKQVDPVKDPRGKVNTRVTFGSVPTLPNSETAIAANYRLLKSTQSVYVWHYPTGKTKVVDSSLVHLDSLVRQIKVGDPILFEKPSKLVDINIGIVIQLLSAQFSVASLSTNIDESVPPIISPVKEQTLSQQLANVTDYAELIWYANPDEPDDDPEKADPTKPPNSESKKPPIPIPHTQLTFQPSLSNDWKNQKILVHYAWQEVGQLIETPATTFSPASPNVKPASAIALPTGARSLLIEDADGNGLSATASEINPKPTLQLSNLPNSPVQLKPPLQLLFNLLSVSRGQTVPAEILGSGDASIAGQEFVLKQSPLTYLLSKDSTSGENYKSTLRIWVDGIEWKEVPSFYGQPADARVFVTREDENQHTHIQFGDGINGARLSSGMNNVVARYRYGSGAESPDAGTLNVIVKPYPNLKAIRNPVPVGGGAEPDPPEQIRRYAPQSVLTFGRAVSGDDYEAIAAQTPGVARAKAYWTWDANQQRSLVKIYVGDDQSAVNAAKVALTGAADPNRPVVVEQAIAIPIKLILSLRIESTRLREPVVAAVQDALIHPENGLFGIKAVQIGQAIYQSQIHQVCLNVPGVIAVHGLQLLTNLGKGFELDSNYRHDPGEGKFYQLSAENLKLS
jgi:hypothetical protein